MQKTAFQKLFVLMVLLGVLIPVQGGFSQGEQAVVENQIFLPLVLDHYPPVILTNIWVGNAGGYERSAFRPGEEIRYITVGENNSGQQISVDLQWDQVGPCGVTQIFKGSLTLEPGIWADTIQETAPVCLGTYTNTVKLTYQDLSYTQTTIFEVVNFTSEIVFSDQQGFDKCGLPTVAQMQTWWLESPYWVFNIYLGGSSFACNNPGLTTDWVWQVSQQGWDFILTWVGPQSPCFSTTKPKINLNQTIAYQQGQSEADLAITAAENLGFSGDKIIYYDLEGYETASGDYSCRNAVDAFITGWTSRLHERGFKAGAYGSPCRSYVSDWWNNQPLLDDIWIARWITPAQYRPDVTVWGEACGLTDAMWPNHQRLRQYAGDHYETWGDVYIGSIDSNVLLGEITAITTTNQAPSASLPFTDSSLADPLLREAQLLTSTSGWVLQGNQLLLTRDAGKSWQVINPPEAASILALDFLDAQTGWLVSLSSQGELTLHQTEDSGISWENRSLPPLSPEVGAVYLDLTDAQTGWLVFKLVSGSNFSRGRLFATQDGGRTWDERSLPLGEPVQFSDPLQGWVAGGPAENEFYRTENGGLSWQAADQQTYTAETSSLQPESLPENAVQVSPADAQNAWVLTQVGGCSGEKNTNLSTANTSPLQCWQQTQLWNTSDGGQTWQEVVIR